ncbi:MAG: ATP-binding protein [Prevotella sp.]|nr:ATP-binding protein [Prevotella sp.]
MEQVQDILIGREAEIKQLDAIASSKEAEFVVVYGRRRVGKTFLVNTYFNDKYAFKLTGLARKGKREQLANFATSLTRCACNLWSFSYFTKLSYQMFLNEHADFH